MYLLILIYVSCLFKVNLQTIPVMEKQKRAPKNRILSPWRTALRNAAVHQAAVERIPDTANTPQTVVGANNKSLNDSMLNDTSVSDTSISSMFELPGNTSFHEASIAFSSTCIKAQSEITLPSDSAVEFEDVANDSVAMKDCIVTLQS